MHLRLPFPIMDSCLDRYVTYGTAILRNTYEVFFCRSRSRWNGNIYCFIVRCNLSWLIIKIRNLSNPGFECYELYELENGMIFVVILLKLISLNHITNLMMVLLHVKICRKGVEFWIACTFAHFMQK